MTFDLNEIPDDKKFEDLVVSYFENLKHLKGHSITDVSVKPSGTGTDGGRDILITLDVTDTIATFKKRWVVQCKFHNSDISTDKIADINIPTLLHSYKASGYLLVCKQKPTSKLTNLFEQLETNCAFERKYEVWSGEQFKTRLINNEQILQQFFPNYFDYITKLKQTI